MRLVSFSLHFLCLKKKKNTKGEFSTLCVLSYQPEGIRPCLFVFLSQPGKGQLIAANLLEIPLRSFQNGSLLSQSVWNYTRSCLHFHFLNTNLIFDLHLGGNQPWIDGMMERTWLWRLAFLFSQYVLSSYHVIAVHRGTRDLTVPASSGQSGCWLCRSQHFVLEHSLEKQEQG